MDVARIRIIKYLLVMLRDRTMKIHQIRKMEGIVKGS
jgi:hypothetical protein